MGNKNKTTKKHEEIYIHIKKKTIKNIIFWGFIIFMFGYSLTTAYELIRESGYSEGFLDGQDYKVNETVTKFREFGQVKICYYDECEWMYKYVDICGDKPDYCSWTFNKGDITTLKINKTGKFVI